MDQDKVAAGLKAFKGDITDMTENDWANLGISRAERLKDSANVYDLVADVCRRNPDAADEAGLNHKGELKQR